MHNIFISFYHAKESALARLRIYDMSASVSDVRYDGLDSDIIHVACDKRGIRYSCLKALECFRL